MTTYQTFSLLLNQYLNLFKLKHLQGEHRCDSIEREFPRGDENELELVVGGVAVGFQLVRLFDKFVERVFGFGFGGNLFVGGGDDLAAGEL